MTARAIAILLGLLLLSAPAPAQEPPDPMEAHRPGIEAALAALLESAKDPTEKGFTEHWDVERMVERLESLLDDELRERLRDPGLLAGLTFGFRVGIAAWSSDFVYESAEILRLTESGDSVIALVRLRDSDGFVSRSRYWFRQSGGLWRIWDFEEVAISLRATTAMGAALADALVDGDPPAWLKAMERLVTGLQAMAEEDPWTADEILQEVADVELPPEIANLRTFLLASVRIAQDRNEEAMEALRGLEAVDMPIREYLWAVVRNRRGEHELALAHARRYLVLAGNDADGRFEEGFALDSLGRSEAALEAYRTGLLEDPSNFDLYVELVDLLPDGATEEIDARFRAMPDAVLLFEPIVIELLDRGNRSAAETLIAALREIAPGDPNADYYTAEILAEDGKHAEAAKILAEAIPRVTDPDERWAYETSYLDRMADCGRALEAYHFLKGSDLAFEHVSDYLDAIGDGETLLTLVTDHAERSPNSPYLPFNRGRALALLGRRAEAEKAFADAMTRDVDEYDLEWFRDARVVNLYEAGEWGKAYTDVGPVLDTFLQLAWLLSDDGNADALAELIALHRKSGGDPAESRFAYFSAEILFLRGEYAKALALLTAKKEEMVREEVDTLYQWEDRVFRSLLRLGRIEEARKLALEIDARDDDPYYPAIAHAAAGDMDAAAQALTRVWEFGFTSEEVYADEDLEPLLRAENAERLREIFPEPD